MLKSTAQLDFEDIHSNAKETDNKNYSLIEKTDVEDTPFMIISTEEGHFIVMGENRLSEPYKNKAEALTAAKKITWNRIVQVILIISDKLETIKNLANENS